MFDKKSKPDTTLYRLVKVPTPGAEETLNKATEGGYRFLAWFDDKWERNGYSSDGFRLAIYIKTP